MEQTARRNPLFKRRYRFLLALIALIPFLGACNSRTPPVEVGDLAGRTTEALSELLLGPSEDDPTRIAPQDKPLLQRGLYETAYLVADGKGFETASRRVLTEKRVSEIMRAVAEDLNKRGKRRGVSIRALDYPATLTEAEQDKAVIATFTPAITDVSPTVGAQAKRDGDKLLMARLTVVDARTKTTIAERLYYTGTDVGGPQTARPLRYIKVH